MYGSQMAPHLGLGGPLGTPVVSWAGPELGAVSEIQGRPNMVHAGSCHEHVGLLEACWSIAHRAVWKKVVLSWQAEACGR